MIPVCVTDFSSVGAVTQIMCPPNAPGRASSSLMQYDAKGLLRGDRTVWKKGGMLPKQTDVSEKWTSGHQSSAADVKSL